MDFTGNYIAFRLSEKPEWETGRKGEEERRVVMISSHSRRACPKRSGGTGVGFN
jgi:hypothetical protein